MTFLLWVRRNRTVGILTAWTIHEAQACGLWPSLLGHALVTAPWLPGTLLRSRLCEEKEKAEAQREKERDSMHVLNLLSQGTLNVNLRNAGYWVFPNTVLLNFTNCFLKVRL